ncbi:MAG TPA: hypothetical protein VNH83_06470 [Bryobacteraceae bacterium]|nr:hypothetical protein [Bryobacteraceae bacterium]
MQCLYCDTPLKPFRGLFDEDFCCREHRDKYSASFRKALNRLPVLDFPPTPVAESLWPVQRQPEEPVFSSDLSKTPTEIHDPPYIETLADVDRGNEHVDGQATPVLDIPAEPLESPAAAYTAGEPADAELSVYSDETAFGPPSADFLPVALAATAGMRTARAATLDTLPACSAIEFPKGMLTWAAALELEQRPAELLDPPEMAASGGFVPMPAALELSAESPTLTAAAPVLPESAESAAHNPCQGAYGYASPWNYADPLTPAPLALTLAPFSPPTGGAAWLPTAGFADFTLACQPLASSPVAVPELAPTHEFHAPVFTPSAEPSLADETRDDIQAEISDELPAESLAPSEIAPALVMNSAPLDSPAFMPARAAEMMPPALAFSSAVSPLNAPGLAPELMADIAQSPAANQPAQPHAHAPLRHFFGSSVRIKNWRLRITFAKPA